jgi:hypothetical protein
MSSCQNREGPYLLRWRSAERQASPCEGIGRRSVRIPCVDAGILGMKGFPMRTVSKLRIGERSMAGLLGLRRVENAISQICFCKG